MHVAAVPLFCVVILSGWSLPLSTYQFLSSHYMFLLSALRLCLHPHLFTKRQFLPLGLLCKRSCPGRPVTPAACTAMTSPSRPLSCSNAIARVRGSLACLGRDCAGHWFAKSLRPSTPPSRCPLSGLPSAILHVIHLFALRAGARWGTCGHRRRSVRYSFLACASQAVLAGR